MIYPSIKTLLEKVDNKYSMVAITAKRARQLVDKQEKYIDIDSTNPVTIAINEINQGMIEYSHLEDIEE